MHEVPASFGVLRDEHTHNITNIRTHKNNNSASILKNAAIPTGQQGVFLNFLNAYLECFSDLIVLADAVFQRTYGYRGNQVLTQSTEESQPHNNSVD